MDLELLPTDSDYFLFTASAIFKNACREKITVESDLAGQVILWNEWVNVALQVLYRAFRCQKVTSSGVVIAGGGEASCPHALVTSARETSLPVAATVEFPPLAY